MGRAKVGRQLGRTTAERKSLFRNLASDLFKYEEIKTTEAKAKELKRFAEKIITRAKKGDAFARRIIKRDITNKEVVKKLIDVLAVRYAQRNGGYTRILKLGFRVGDGARVCMIRLV
ncbi:50S ribosomal protein L17 [bacterium]|nr:50S ribosomal protein L17 [bacterium]